MSPRDSVLGEFTTLSFGDGDVQVKVTQRVRNVGVQFVGSMFELLPNLLVVPDDIVVQQAAGQVHDDVVDGHDVDPLYGLRVPVLQHQVNGFQKRLFQSLNGGKEGRKKCFI